MVWTDYFDYGEPPEQSASCRRAYVKKRLDEFEQNKKAGLTVDAAEEQRIAQRRQERLNRHDAFFGLDGGLTESLGRLSAGRSSAPPPGPR